MNLIVIVVGLFLAVYSAYGLAWSRQGGKKPQDEIVRPRGAPLKVRAFQIRLTIMLAVGLVIFLVGFAMPSWP
jgi:hypothetical protein